MADIPKIANFMSKRFVTLAPELNIYEAVDILLKKKVTGAAVVDKKGGLVGILSEKDCLNILVQGLYDETPGKKVSEYMIREVITVSPETDILKVATVFLENSFRRLLVVNKKGKLIGLVTRGALLKIMRYKNKKKYSHISGSFLLVNSRNLEKTT